MVQFGVVWEFFLSCFDAFPSSGRIAAAGDFFGFENGPFHGGHALQDIVQLLLFLGIHRGRSDEAQFIIVNLAMVFLAEKAVEIVHRLLLHIGLREDRVSHFSKGGVAWPDFSR